MTAAAAILKVRGLKVHFETGRRGGGGKSMVHAVDGVSFDVPKGGSFGIVGESGSGKTTVAMALLRLVAATAGSVELDGEPVLELGKDALRKMRRRIQIIFQDPYSSLNPRMRAGQIVREPMDLMRIGDSRRRDAEVRELFELVGLRPEQTALFPHQFSGGQRQRIGIARALATRPDVVICDEPVSALDVAIQAQILNLLSDLQSNLGLTYLFISHDLGVVQHICDNIAVMYMGEIIEQADRISLFSEPRHPYTRALISAVPSADFTGATRAQRMRLEGDPPSPIDPPAGCRFAGRCPFAEEPCGATTPALRALENGNKIACHRADEIKLNA
ncbi:MAG: ATP-binding cassette domain-containing protein [Alphaproteobacteria bacterium]|nr:ATP-binding cassette domain-containing protein [Alphaproteobacteria bacterium]